MHLAEIIQNVIDPETPGDHDMEPAPTPTPTPTPASHESTVIDSPPEPSPRKKRKLPSQGREGTHERPIDIDASDDDDDDEEDHMIVKVLGGSGLRDIKPTLQPGLEYARKAREDSSNEGIRAAGVERHINTLHRREALVPSPILDAKTSSGSNHVRIHTPTSIDLQTVDDSSGAATPSVPTTHKSSQSSSLASSSSSPAPRATLQSPKGTKGDTATTSASLTTSSIRLPVTNSNKSASTSSTNRITPLSHAMLSSIHGEPNPNPPPIKDLTPVAVVPHRASPSSSLQSQSDPKSTDSRANKDDFEIGKDPQKSTSELLDEDTAEFRGPPNESRCRSPIDISALRQQRQVAIDEASDPAPTSPIAVITGTIHDADSSNPNRAPIKLSEVISTKPTLRDLSQAGQAGAESSSHATESTASIIAAKPPSHSVTDTFSAPDMVVGHLRAPQSAAVLRKGAMGSGTSAGPIPHITSTPAQTITKAPSHTSSAPANIDRTHKPNPPIVSTIPPLHPSLPPKPSTLSRNQEYSALELSQFQTVLDNNGSEHRWLTIKRGFRSHDLRFSVTAETRAGLISQVFKNRGWLEGVYGSQATNVGLYLDGRHWLPSWTVQQMGLWEMLAPGAKRAYLIEVELTYSSVMHA